MRGVKKPNSTFKTLVKTGLFKKDESLVHQFLIQIGSEKNKYENH